MCEINEKKQKNNDIKDILKTIGFSIVLVITISVFFRLTIVSGNSMLGTLHNNDKLILNTFSKNFKYKDIIVINRNDLSIKYFIKRVIAVSGDTFEIKDNKVIVNGNILEEDYINEDMITEDISQFTIPEGKLFAMGDNRNHSMDSRSNIIGLIDIKNEITGKTVFNISKFKK